MPQKGLKGKSGCFTAGHLILAGREVRRRSVGDSRIPGREVVAE